MEELEVIQRRMERTHHEGKKEKKHGVYRFLMILMLVLSLGLGFLIYARVDENGTVVNRIFHTQLNFTHLNEKMNTFFDRMFNFNLVNGEDDQPVSASISYSKTDTPNYYKTEDGTIPTLKKGIISYIDEKDGKSFIMISYQNGVVASYFDVLFSLVKVGDELKAGERIGEYEDAFKVIFTKGNEMISYEEALL